MADNDDVDMNLLFTVYCQSMLFTRDGTDAALPADTYPILSVLCE